VRELARASGRRTRNKSATEWAPYFVQQQQKLLSAYKTSGETEGKSGKKRGTRGRKPASASHKKSSKAEKDSKQEASDSDDEKDEKDEKT